MAVPANFALLLPLNIVYVLTKIVSGLDEPPNKVLVHYFEGKFIVKNHKEKKKYNVCDICLIIDKNFSNNPDIVISPCRCLSTLYIISVISMP